MKKIISVLSLFAYSLLLSCSIDFYTSNTDTFKIQALTTCYVCRKLDTWISENNGAKIAKDLEYAYYKGQKAVPVIDCINSKKEPEKYFNQLINYSEVINLINTSSGFQEYINKVEKKIKKKEHKKKC